jgi:hypothetical protein
MIFSWLDVIPIGPEMENSGVLLIGLSNSYICGCEVRCKGFWSSLILMKIFQNV